MGSPLTTVPNDGGRAPVACRTLPYEEADRIVGDTTYHNLVWLFAPQRPAEAFGRAHARGSAGPVHRARAAELRGKQRDQHA